MRPSVWPLATTCTISAAAAYDAESAKRPEQSAAIEARSAPAALDGATGLRRAGAAGAGLADRRRGEGMGLTRTCGAARRGASIARLARAGFATRSLPERKAVFCPRAFGGGKMDA